MRNTILRISGVYNFDGKNGIIRLYKYSVAVQLTSHSIHINEICIWVLGISFFFMRLPFVVEA